MVMAAAQPVISRATGNPVNAVQGEDAVALLIARKPITAVGAVLIVIRRIHGRIVVIVTGVRIVCVKGKGQKPGKAKGQKQTESNHRSPAKVQ